MRLLVVGFAASAHLARHLQLLQGSGWDVHLLDAQAEPDPHPELPALTLHPARAWAPAADSPVRVAAPPEEEPAKSFGTRVAHLLDLFDELRPDVIHSHGIQQGGALVAGALRERGRLGAPWAVSNAGPDIHWWGRVPSRGPLIRHVLEACDWFGAECHRDVALARAFGFRGRVMGVWPLAGGIDVEHATALRAPGPASARRAIAVAGATDALGRGDVALDAVARCADLLDGWELCLHDADDAVAERAAAVAAGAGMRLTRVAAEPDALLRMHGRARVSIGLSRSEALGTSLTEAVALGSFPLRARSSCGQELTPAGRAALFVPTTDPEAVTTALRRALTDDALVDGAADLNARLAREHLDRRLLRARVVDAYERIVLGRALEAAA